MAGSAESLEQSVAITDPGEKDRDLQSWADRIVIQVGNVTAWLFPILMLAICTQVVIRKMGFNQAWLDDAQWWMYGFAMTVGFAYAITTQSHVRVDILHQHFPPKKKARIEVIGLGWFLLPFLLMMTDFLLHYGFAAWRSGEGSSSPNGLHGLYLLKMSLPVLFLLAALATVSMVTRHLALLAPVRLWSVVLACLPGAWLVAERLCFYVLWWVLRMTNPELAPRRISREPLMDFTIWYGLALVLAVLAFGLVQARRANQEG